MGDRSVSATERVEVGDQVFFRELDGETVLLNIDTGQYYGLDEVGTRIFLLLREHQALDKVLSILEAEQGVPKWFATRDSANSGTKELRN